MTVRSSATVRYDMMPSGIPHTGHRDTPTARTLVTCPLDRKERNSIGLRADRHECYAPSRATEWNSPRPAGPGAACSWRSWQRSGSHGVGRGTRRESRVQASRSARITSTKTTCWDRIGSSTSEPRVSSPKNGARRCSRRDSWTCRRTTTRSEGAPNAGPGGPEPWRGRRTGRAGVRCCRCNRRACGELDSAE